MNKSKKYILCLIILLGIFFYYYIYYVNNSEYKTPYSYTGSTVGYFNDKHNGHKLEKSDWDIKYIVEPLNKNNFSSSRKFNYFEKLIVIDPTEMKSSKLFSDDIPYQGKLYLHYKGENPKLIQEISKISISIDWEVGDPKVTSGFYDMETGRLLDATKEPIYDYLANDNFTPHKSAVMDFELHLTLLDDTKIRYFGSISTGPKSIFNLRNKNFISF